MVTFSNIWKWATHSLKRIQTDGVKGLSYSVHPVYIKMFQQSSRLHNPGESIWEYDWDVLVILDACRYDLMKEVGNNFDYIDSINKKTSKASMTMGWMKENFKECYHDEMKSTTYVCGNPFSNSVLNSDDFANLDEIWRAGWDDSLHTLPARSVTDRAINRGREGFDRMIVHYMQPHHPFIKNPEFSGTIEKDDWPPEGDVWDRVHYGELNKEDAWNEYRNNLNYVLNDVDLLLSNINAEKVVITSDHGNAIGEWGIYGHPNRVPIGVLRNVPWIVTSGIDNKTHNPKPIENKINQNSSVEDRLQALGYK